jgi:triacylglycerol lipase
MTLVLSPGYAANLANDVYAIKSGITRDDFLDLYKADMEVTKAKLATGVTGGYILNKPQVMAVFSSGKGAYRGQAFAAFMGTASLYDALTDLNTGVIASHTGALVHQGFHRAFDSLLPELRQFVAGLNGVMAVHCVGHSLGGALATLAADWLRASGSVARANLYTFGSPRVGLSMFAEKCTERVVGGHIYRAHHATDPIPMVPTWPFFHVPRSGQDYLIHSPVAAVPWEYHLMKHYIRSAEAASSWQKMHSNRPQGYGRVAVEKWLKSDGLMALTANTLGLLGAALHYVVEKAAQATGIALVTGFSTTFTLLDRMAFLLAKAERLAVDTSIWVHHLVKKMAALVGIVVQAGVELTMGFIRLIFLKLHHRISDMVRQIGRSL